MASGGRKLNFFLIFSSFFLFSGGGLREAETYFFPIFFLFGHAGPKPYSVAGQRDRKSLGHFPRPHHSAIHSWGRSSSTTKKLCDKDFAERSGELSDAICLKAFVLPSDTKLLRK